MAESLQGEGGAFWHMMMSFENESNGLLTPNVTRESSKISAALAAITRSYTRRPSSTVLDWPLILYSELAAKLTRVSNFSTPLAESSPTLEFCIKRACAN
jgi:hypothetical protein